MQMKQHSFVKMAAWFPELTESDWISFVWSKEQWLHDKVIIIIELGYRKILWFVSVLRINYLSRPLASANNWSAYHWSTLLNSFLLLLALILLYIFRLVWTGILRLFIPKLEKEGYWTVAVNVSFNKLLFSPESRGFSEQVN